MNAFITIVLVCLFSCANAWEAGDWEEYGLFHKILNSMKCEQNRSLNLDVSGIYVYFYDFSVDRIQSFAVDDAARGILSIKGLDKRKKIIFYCGGYTSDIKTINEGRIRNTFRNYPNSYLIIIDHSAYTNDNPGYKKGYETAVKYVHYIGKALGKMLAELRNGGVNPKNIHCIGYSLGGQILGSIGETFTKTTGDKIRRITAIDPAGPCFSNSLAQEQVRSGLAEYVEVYHCNAGELGSSSVLADIDFFANKKGLIQPNCGAPYIPELLLSAKAGICSHKKCIEFYISTVTHPEWFPAWKCDSYKVVKEGRCPINNMTTTAGFWNPGTATGVYYFQTEGYLLHKLLKRTRSRYNLKTGFRGYLKN